MRVVRNVENKREWRAAMAAAASAAMRAES
jgi:hypothetical protein